jgi:radical SAM protein with 4Fe4S-binding SPASM domain
MRTNVEKIQLLREHAEFYATCPRCESIEVCQDNCTFEDYEPIDHQKMLHARYVLQETKDHP